MTTLRLAVDPALEAQFGPEIHWTWRTLLAGQGWAWQVVPLGEPCEVAYTADPARAGAARVCIQADPALWAQRATLRLAAVTGGPTAWPQYTGQATPPAVVAAGVCPRDVVFDVFWLMTGQEERHWPKDRHGYLDYAGGLYEAERVHSRGLASAAASWLEAQLVAVGVAAPQPRWPAGKRAAAAAGHDVDYPEVVRWLEPARVLARSRGRALGPALEVALGRRHHWHFQSWMKLEQAFGARSAFYFVPRQGSLVEYATGLPDSFYDVTTPRFRALFGELRAAGFEIGVHASYLAHTSEAKFAAEKQRLEAASNGAVTGNRHHYWHLDPVTPEDTLALHARVGFTYDSSLNHNRYLGWRRHSARPFFPFHPGRRTAIEVLQVPVAWMDDQLFSMRAHNPGDRMARLRELIDGAADQGGCFVMDVHEYVFDDALFPEWAATYQRAWAYLRERGDFWFATPLEIAQHWRARHAALEAESHGLMLGRAPQAA